MLISSIIGCGIILGSLLVLRIMQLRKRRVEKKKVLEQRLEHLILTNKKNLRKIVLLALPLAKGQTASFYTKKSRSKLETTLFV